MIIEKPAVRVDNQPSVFLIEKRESQRTPT